MSEATVLGWNPADLETVSCCPVCGSRRRHVLYRGLTDRLFHLKGEWTLQQCADCQSGYLDPRPTPETIGRAYSDYFTHSDDGHRVVRRIRGIRVWLHDLVNGYQNHRYGFRNDPANAAGRWLVPCVPPLCAAADAEARNLPPPRRGGSLLDVGCGNGGFLVLARTAGWRVEGVDFDIRAVEMARSRGLTIHLGGIEALGDRRECFDLITLSHVIEHVYDPLAMLKHAHRLLKPGGRLWLETPNLQSLGARRYGPNWRGLEPPRHLVLFTPSSLSRLLQEAGFSSNSQLWHGMSSFDVFAASEALARNGKAMNASYRGKPPLSNILIELREMIFKSTREFLTYTACKV